MVTYWNAVYLINFFFSEKPPSEATLRGHEYFYYDLAQTGGEPIVSSSDEISLYFKTRQATGMLFYTGKHTMILEVAGTCSRMNEGPDKPNDTALLVSIFQAMEKIIWP